MASCRRFAARRSWRFVPRVCSDFPVLSFVFNSRRQFESRCYTVPGTSRKRRDTRKVYLQGRVQVRTCTRLSVRPVFAVSPRRRAMADVSPAHLHVVFSAECIPAFDWQSAGLFYSFNRTRQPGKITRLLACSDEQLASYPKSNLDMGPTFVHLNMRFDAVNDIERGDPFHDDKAGHGCPPPPSNSKAFFPVPHMRSAAAAQTPATTSHSLSWRGLSRSTLRRTLCS